MEAQVSAVSACGITPQNSGSSWRNVPRFALKSSDVSARKYGGLQKKVPSTSMRSTEGFNAECVGWYGLQWAFHVGEEAVSRNSFDIRRNKCCDYP